MLRVQDVESAGRVCFRCEMYAGGVFASCKSECMVARNVDRGLIYPPVYVLQMSCVILLFLLVQTKAR